MYFWISAFDHRAIVVPKMHIVHCWETGVEEVQTKVKDLMTPLIATLRRQAKSKSKGAELLLSKITN